MGVYLEKYHAGVYPQHAALFIGKAEENPKNWKDRICKRSIH